MHAVVRGAQQRVPSQAKPLQQSDAALQTELEPGWMQQTSPRPQRRPSSQIRPVQQAPPVEPQGPVGITLPSGRVVVPSILPPSRVGLFSAHPTIAIPSATTDAKSQARSPMTAMVAAHAAQLTASGSSDPALRLGRRLQPDGSGSTTTERSPPHIERELAACEAS